MDCGSSGHVSFGRAFVHMIVVYPILNVTENKQETA